ncbi:unnamed protein product [Protopolystoma xenopodis]|uniref:Uncharacterized protein n=1 Tax=Protopolystoma xenopodis TaxID=117903 RepID=A0A3S5AX46_9PLAT|nr:unnamed protein product [Protopolystoma xenopodis]
MSPKNVSLQVGLVKRNHLRHRYRVPFAQLLTYNLPPFSYSACQLVTAKHNNQYVGKLGFEKEMSKWTKLGYKKWVGLKQATFLVFVFWGIIVKDDVHHITDEGSARIRRARKMVHQGHIRTNLQCVQGNLNADFGETKLRIPSIRLFKRNKKYSNIKITVWTSKSLQFLSPIRQMMPMPVTGNLPLPRL